MTQFTTSIWRKETQRYDIVHYKHIWRKETQRYDTVR